MITLEFLRTYRMLDYAVFDLIAATLGMVALSPILSRITLKLGVSVPKRSWVIWTLPIGIIAHMITNTNTLMTTRFIESGNYGIKAVIAVLVIVGIYGVKRRR